jgi:hypothetical protein
MNGLGGLIMSVAHNQSAAENLARSNDDHRKTCLTQARLEAASNPFFWFQAVLCGSQVYAFGWDSISHLASALLVEVAMLGLILLLGRAWYHCRSNGPGEDPIVAQHDAAVLAQREMDHLSPSDSEGESDGSDGGMDEAIKTKVYLDKLKGDGTVSLSFRVWCQWVGMPWVPAMANDAYVFCRMVRMVGWCCLWLYATTMFSRDSPLEDWDFSAVPHWYYH